MSTSSPSGGIWIRIELIMLVNERGTSAMLCNLACVLATISAPLSWAVVDVRAVCLAGAALFDLDAHLLGEDWGAAT